ncbi:MAG: hypothetical protein ACKOEX_00210 [Planctomycetia bacterium]
MTIHLLPKTIMVVNIFRCTPRSSASARCSPRGAKTIRVSRPSWRLTMPSERMEAMFLFLAVWRLEDGAWRFLEWQSARPPEAGKAP